MGRPLSPVDKSRPLQPYKLLEGAATLLKIADILRDTLDQHPVTQADGPKRKIPVIRYEVAAFEHIARLTAYTMDDLIYIVEKQEIKIAEQRAIIEKLIKEDKE